MDTPHPLLLLTLHHDTPLCFVMVCSSAFLFFFYVLFLLWSIRLVRIQTTLSHITFIISKSKLLLGLFGFDKLGPESIPPLQIHYWNGVEKALAKLGAKVVVAGVPR